MVEGDRIEIGITDNHYGENRRLRLTGHVEITENDANFIECETPTKKRIIVRDEWGPVSYPGGILGDELCGGTLLRYLQPLTPADIDDYEDMCNYKPLEGKWYDRYTRHNKGKGKSRRFPIPR